MSAIGAARGLNYALLIASTVCAAGGQIMFKYGSTGRSAPLDFINPQIAAGGVLYVLGAVMWVVALSRVPLSLAYPFTASTFVLVYLASILLFREQPSPGAIVGVLLVLAGLAAILWSR